jgi:hypothetical protein
MPANAAEAAVLKLAPQHVPSDWTMPTGVAPGPTEGTYIVTYETPAEEVKLLGLRQIIVDPVTETAQFVPRD